MKRQSHYSSTTWNFQFKAKPFLFLWVIIYETLTTTALIYKPQQRMKLIFLSAILNQEQLVNFLRTLGMIIQIVIIHIYLNYLTYLIFTISWLYIYHWLNKYYKYYMDHIIYIYIYDPYNSYNHFSALKRCLRN